MSPRVARDWKGDILSVLAEGRRLTVAEIADEMGVHRNAIYYFVGSLCAAGVIQGVRRNVHGRPPMEYWL